MARQSRTRGSAVRSSVDVGALSSAVQRRGIDPGVWVKLAIVTDVGFDPEQGMFADIRWQPDGGNDTALIGSNYAGDGFGDWNNLEVGDTVLVAIPDADTGNGPVIFCRMWNGGDPPPADFGTDSDPQKPVGDRVIRVKPKKKFRLYTSGEGDGIVIKAEGDGNIEMMDASQSFVRGDAQKTALNDFFSALSTWAIAVKAGIVAGGGTLDNTAFDQAIAEVKQGLSDALSTRIKGQ